MVKDENWPKIKKSGLCEYEQVSFLEVDGKKYCKSHSINIYIAAIFNLMGKDPEETYQIRNILMTLDKYMITIWGALFYKDESKKDDIKKLMRKN